MITRGLLCIGLIGGASLAGCGSPPPPLDGNVVSDTTGATTGSGSGGGSEASTSARPPRTLQAALTDFGSCMSIDVFMYSGTYKLATETAMDGGTAKECVACHTNGMAGSYISVDALDMFEHDRQFPFIMRLVTGTVDEKGNFKDLVPSNRYAQAGQCDQQPCHPTYTLNDQIAAGIDQFVTVTLDRWHNKTCDQKYNPGPGN